VGHKGNGAGELRKRGGDDARAHGGVRENGALNGQNPAWDNLEGRVHCTMQSEEVGAARLEVVPGCPQVRPCRVRACLSWHAPFSLLSLSPSCVVVVLPPSPFLFRRGAVRSVWASQRKSDDRQDDRSGAGPTCGHRGPTGTVAHETGSRVVVGWCALVLSLHWPCVCVFHPPPSSSSHVQGRRRQVSDGGADR